MSQIATMNVRIGADIAPLQRGLKEAQASVDRSAKLMGTSLSSSATSSDGTRVATEFLRGLQSEFSQANTKLKAALFQGSLTPEQFRREGMIVAREFNAGITSGLDTYGSQGLLTPEMEAKMVRGYKKAGLESATGFVGSMKPALDEGGEKFELFGHHGAHALLKITGGLMAISAATDNTEPGIKRVFKGIEGLGMMLAPPAGFVVAALAAGAEAITGYFMHARDEITKTRKTFEDEVAVMVRAGDSIGLQKKAQSILVGDVAGEPGKGGGFKGGLYDLRAEIQADKAALATAISQRDVFAFNSLKKSIATLTAEAAPLEAEYATVVRRILNPPTLPREITGMKPVMITAGGKSGGSGGGGGAGKNPLDTLTSGADTLMALQKNVAAGGAYLDGLNGRLVNTYDSVTAALARQTDQYSALSLKLREVQNNLLGVNVVQMARGNTLGNVNSLLSIAPGTGSAMTNAGLTSVPTSPLAENTINKLNINTSNLPSVPGKLDVLKDATVGALKDNANMIASSLTTVMGVRNAGTGGAIGSVIGGALGGKVLGGLLSGAVGHVIGGTLGSVIPVVGTVLGGIAGGAIGKGLGSVISGIGGLFGHHKKAVDNSATALNSMATAAQRVSESLTNVPTGFKVALARYDATSTSGGFALPPTRGGDGGGVRIYGPVTFNGVQDIDEFSRQVGNYELQQSARGGTRSLGLALA